MNIFNSKNNNIKVKEIPDSSFTIRNPLGSLYRKDQKHTWNFPQKCIRAYIMWLYSEYQNSEQIKIMM